MASVDDLDSAKQELKRKLKKELDALELATEKFVERRQTLIPYSKGPLGITHEELTKFAWSVISILLLGVVVVMIGVGTLFIDFGALKFSYYKHAKNTNTQKALVDNLQDQQAVITSIQRLEKKIEALELSIEVKKAITDVTDGQKLLTNSVQHLEKELKQLYQNEKGIANILSEQKTLSALVRNLQEDLKELKVLYQIEKNTDDIINSQNKFIDSFQSLEKEVHKLTELSQDDTSSKIEEELKNILQSLENRRSGTQYQKIVYR